SAAGARVRYPIRHGDGAGDAGRADRTEPSEESHIAVGIETPGVATDEQRGGVGSAATGEKARRELRAADGGREAGLGHVPDAVRDRGEVGSELLLLCP